MTFVWKHPKYYKELIKQQRDPRHNQWGNLGEPKNHEDEETVDRDWETNVIFPP